MTNDLDTSLLRILVAYQTAAAGAVPVSEHPADASEWPWAIALLGEDRRALIRQRDALVAEVARLRASLAESTSPLKRVKR